MAVALSRVYVAAVPLGATAGPAKLAMSAAYSLGIWEFQHFMVLVRSSLTTPAEVADNDVVVFYFQPQDSEDVFVALAESCCRRKLARPPRRRCWLVGYCEEDALEIASMFSHGWKTDLTVGTQDCRYTIGLVESLTREKNVLERLKSNKSHHG